LGLPGETYQSIREQIDLLVNNDLPAAKAGIWMLLPEAPAFSKEMRERIEKIVGSKARSLFMGTFHSVLARILRTKSEALGYTNNFTIYDTDDAKSVLKSIVKDFALNDSIYKPNVLYNRISYLKNNLVNYNIYSKNQELIYEDEEAHRPKFGEVFKEYTKRCMKNNAMDFDDLLFRMYELLN
jgi:DNA helicase-2/ATP-dependent DNA helicase PcrA